MVQLIYQSTTTTVFCAEVCCCLSCQILCSVAADMTQVVAYFPIGVASSRILHQPIDVVYVTFYDFVAMVWEQLLFILLQQSDAGLPTHEIHQFLMPALAGTYFSIALWRAALQHVVGQPPCCQLSQSAEE